MISMIEGRVKDRTTIISDISLTRCELAMDTESSNEFNECKC